MNYKSIINLDLSSISGSQITGVGVYIKNLADKLALDQDIVLKGSYKISRYKGVENIKNRIDFPLSFPYIPYIYNLIPKKFDLFHGPDFWLPKEKGFKKIVTIHDLSIFQQGFWSNERMTKSIKEFSEMINICKPDHVITVSDTIKKELIAQFPHLEGKVTTIYHGADHYSDHNKLLSLFDFPYLTCIGTIENRKNQLNVFKAFCEIADQYSDLKLVFAGGWHGYMGQEIVDTIKKHPLAQRVIFTGFVSQSEMISIIQNAEMLIYPSLYEGFGFPILEGMRYQTPVITSNFGAMSEIGGDAALKIDPYQYKLISESISKILTDRDLKKQLISKGITHSGSFTWQKCAKETIEVYQNVIDK